MSLTAHRSKIIERRIHQTTKNYHWRTNYQHQKENLSSKLVLVDDARITLHAKIKGVRIQTTYAL